MMEIWEQSLEPRQSTPMSLIDKFEELLNVSQEVENVIYSFHKFRNGTSEEDWQEIEERYPLFEQLLDNLCDLESEAGMENDDESASQCVSG